jgi:hypothetical protein
LKLGSGKVCGKTKVQATPKQTPPVQVMADEKELENVEYFNYLGDVITNDARYTGENKSSIAMERAEFKKKTLYQQIKLKLKEDTSKVLHLEHIFVWCWNISRTELTGKFRNLVLEKDEEDLLDRSSEK